MTPAVSDPPEPTHCADCSASLERGWSRIGEVYRCHGCGDLVAWAEYERTGRLSSKILVTATIYGARREYGHPLPPVFPESAIYEVRRIQTEVAIFERIVWFRGGLQAFARSLRVKGSVGTIGEVDVLVYTMCGRAKITLNAPGSSVSMICAEDSEDATMGVDGIDATEKQALWLLKTVSDGWTVMAMAADEKVGLGW